MSGVDLIFSYSGDLSATVNTLTNVQDPDVSKTLADLSTENFPTPDPIEPRPNPANQLIFMNQPISWWLDGLQNGTIVNFNYGRYVQWKYVDASGNNIYIDTYVTSRIIPDESSHIDRDYTANTHTVVFMDKLGMSRKDLHHAML